MRRHDDAHADREVHIIHPWNIAAGKNGLPDARTLLGGEVDVARLAAASLVLLTGPLALLLLAVLGLLPLLLLALLLLVALTLLPLLTLGVPRALAGCRPVGIAARPLIALCTALTLAVLIALALAALIALASLAGRLVALALARHLIAPLACAVSLAALRSLSPRLRLTTAVLRCFSALALCTALTLHRAARSLAAAARHALGTRQGDARQQGGRARQ
jgi:hypothetical protein